MHLTRAAAADLGLAALVVVLAVVLDPADSARELLPVVIAAVAAGLARTRSLGALALIWLAAAAQVAVDSPVVFVLVAVVVVGYRVGRFASPGALWAAGLSVPAGAAAALVLAFRYPERISSSVVGLVRFSGFGVVGGCFVVLAVLAAPFAVGLLVRTNERYRVSRSQRESAEAQTAIEHDIAESRAKQTQLARDVHDVVGHSLAVIIAQADAARLAAPDDRTRATLAQIATVGRSSLAEVRDVLQRTDDTTVAAARRLAELDELLDGVRSAGHEVRDTVAGTPRALAAESGAAAYRVLQELLTNALKHGSGGAIDVEREWTETGMTLRVANPVASDIGSAVDGMGLTGVRSRVDAAGGTFRTGLVGRGTDRACFVATTFLPVT